jgi:hypothetical protein
MSVTPRWRRLSEHGAHWWTFSISPVCLLQLLTIFGSR